MTETLNTANDVHMGFPWADHARMRVEQPDDYLLSILAADSEGRGASITFDLTSIADLDALLAFVQNLNEVVQGAGDLTRNAIKSGRVTPRP